MTESILGIFPMQHRALPDQPVVPPPADQVPAIPDPAHQQAIDTVFSHHQDQDNLSGLMAAWASTLLLADLAQEHFHVPVEENLPPDPPRLPEQDPPV